MWRWCLAILAFISHILLIAVCVFWLRSYWVADSVSMVASGEHWTFQSESGRYYLVRRKLNPLLPLVMKDFSIDFDVQDVGEYSLNITDVDGYHEHVNFAGFEYGSISDLPRFDAWLVVVPIWFVACILAIFPMWWLIAFRRRYRVLRRIAAGLCGACGYDLRAANHAVCPECGTASPLFRTAAVTAPATPHK